MTRTRSQHTLELGVNWIDTAAEYGLGHSEEVVGRALRDLRDRPYVFTKAGRAALVLDLPDDAWFDVQLMQKT